MGYLHIMNLYRPEAQDVFLFKEVYALEKIHGTSANIKLKDNQITYFSGGASHEEFLSCLDRKELEQKIKDFGYAEMTIYGEAYGGKMQRNAWRYGPRLKFIAFEVNIDGNWLDVPKAGGIAKKLGLDFVYYRKIPCTIEALNAERDTPSAEPIKVGIAEPQPREGIVIRPLIELTKNNGERIIYKHKRDDERETNHARKLGEDIKVIQDVAAVVNDWVTPTRLQHVVDKIPDFKLDYKFIPIVVKSMIEDIYREGKGEFEESKLLSKDISRATMALFKKYVADSIKENHG